MGRRKLDRSGEVTINKNGSEMIISAYRGNKDIDVYFPQYEWTAKNREYKSFRNGEIRCPYEPSVMKRGYIGVGEYLPYMNGKASTEYRSWKSILHCCYDPNHEDYPYYGEEGYTICNEWLDFQTYAQWYKDNHYNLKNQQVILSSKIMNEDKVVSPTNSFFIPRSLSQLLRMHGVTCCHGKYQVNLRYTTVDGVAHNDYLGFYGLDNAKLVYKENKERVVRELAEQYKDYIPTKLYDYMKNFVLDIKDIRVLRKKGE